MLRVYFCCPVSTASRVQTLVIDTISYTMSEVCRTTTHILYEHGPIENTWKTSRYIPVHITDLPFRLSVIPPRGMVHRRPCTDMFPNNTENHPLEYCVGAKEHNRAVEVHFDVPEEV